MVETVQLGLPLLQPSQAQKHVTVNESFSRLDALTQISLVSRALAVPPLSPAEGAAYAVAAAATGEWEGQGGRIAVRTNGGWTFATPKAGWRAWILDEAAEGTFDGTAWRTGLVTLSPSGASAFFRVTELTHNIGSGTVSNVTAAIPANAMVFAVSARVRTPITGTLSSWQLGSTGNANRFGSGLGLPAGSFATGLLSAPTTYYAVTDLVLTATGGSFAGGSVRLAIHALNLTLPN